MVGSRLPLYASQAPFVGSLMTWDSSGYLKTLAAGYPFAGVSTQRKLAMDWVKATPVSGDLLHQIITGRFFITVYLASGLGVTQPFTNRPVYASDDDTFTLTAKDNTFIGKIVAYLDSTHVVVECQTSDVREGAPGSMGVAQYANADSAVNAWDYNKVIIAPITAGRNYTLPAVAGLVGKYFTFQTTGAFALTLTAAGSEIVGGGATYVLASNAGRAVTILGTGVAGSEWVVVGLK